MLVRGAYSLPYFILLSVTHESFLRCITLLQPLVHLSEQVDGQASGFPELHHLAEPPSYLLTQG